MDNLKNCPFCGGKAEFMQPSMLDESVGNPCKIQCENRCQLRGFAIVKKVWDTRKGEPKFESETLQRVKKVAAKQLSDISGKNTPQPVSNGDAIKALDKIENGISGGDSIFFDEYKKCIQTIRAALNEHEEIVSVLEMQRKRLHEIRDLVKDVHAPKPAGEPFRFYGNVVRKVKALIVNSVDVEDELIETLADIEHERWSGWMKYFYDNNTTENNKRWKKQMVTEYKNLPEHSKESDRKEVRKTLDAIAKNNMLAGGKDPKPLVKALEEVLSDYIEFNYNRITDEYDIPYHDKEIADRAQEALKQYEEQDTGG